MGQRWAGKHGGPWGRGSQVTREPDLAPIPSLPSPRPPPTQTGGRNE